MCYLGMPFSEIFQKLEAASDKEKTLIGYYLDWYPQKIKNFCNTHFAKANRYNDFLGIKEVGLFDSDENKKEFSQVINRSRYGVRTEIDFAREINVPGMESYFRDVKIYLQTISLEQPSHLKKIYVSLCNYTGKIFQQLFVDGYFRPEMIGLSVSFNYISFIFEKVFSYLHDGLYVMISVLYKDLSTEPACTDLEFLQNIIRIYQSTKEEKTLCLEALGSVYRTMPVAITDVTDLCVAYYATLPESGSRFSPQLIQKLSEKAAQYTMSYDDPIPVEKDFRMEASADENDDIIGVGTKNFTVFGHSNLSTNRIKEDLSGMSEEKVKSYLHAGETVRIQFMITDQVKMYLQEELNCKIAFSSIVEDGAVHSYTLAEYEGDTYLLFIRSDDSNTIFGLSLQTTDLSESRKLFSIDVNDDVTFDFIFNDPLKEE